MSRSGKYWIYLGLTVLLLLFVFAFVRPHNKRNNSANASLSSYLNEQDTIMSDMMANMTVTPSGNADLDFLNGMIPHHESAIDMSGSYLKHGGTNEKLRELAKEIIDEQSDEIEDMKELIEKIETTGEKDPAMEEGYLNASEKMMAEHRQMQHGATSYADVEDAFAEGMIMHHQMAVDMAKAVLNYTNHEEVRDLAEDIIETQEKEIEKMREILNK